MTSTPSPYQPRRTSRSFFVAARGFRHYVLAWGEPSMASAERPPLVMMHGWMDVAASFQFVVDQMRDDRYVIAVDWRGFGLTESPKTDVYWYPDYLGDLDGVLDALDAPDSEGAGRFRHIDLVGHSMGGNVVMIYAGLRPSRIRRLVNLEGFGMPVSRPEQAPKRYTQWLDELKTPMELRTYPSVDAVAERLQKTNPLLPVDRARWLAQHWSRPVLTPAENTQGREGRSRTDWEILGDPAHKRSNPTLYQVAEVLECWKLITAPVMWVEGDRTDIARWWGTRFTKEEFHRRLDVVAGTERHVVAPAGHMLHHDQPAQLARLLEAFLAG